MSKKKELIYVHIYTPRFKVPLVKLFSQKIKDKEKTSSVSNDRWFVCFPNYCLSFEN